MRYRFTFFAGLAVGFIVGARAGRERYEQLKKVARKAADSPAVQQAAGAAQAQAAGLARSAKDQAMRRVPRLTEKARNTVPGPIGDRIPGLPDAGGQRPLAGWHVHRRARRPGNGQPATWLTASGHQRNAAQRPVGRRKPDRRAACFRTRDAPANRPLTRADAVPRLPGCGLF